MKQKLLLLGAALLMSASMFAQQFTAQWPQPKTPETMKGSDWDLSAETDTIYLWNKGAGGFYTNHPGSSAAPYYGTRAVANDTIGNKVIFTRKNPNADTDESINFADAAENCYLFVTFVNSDSRNFHALYCTFADGWNGIWTDNNGNANRYWLVEKEGDIIKLQPNPELNSNQSPIGAYIGIRAKDAEKIVYYYDTETEGAIDPDEVFYPEWQAVSPEVYEAYIEYAKSDETKQILAFYNAAQKLKSNILYAQENGVDASQLSKYYDVYNNLQSTIEELEAAAAAAYDMGRWVEIAPYFENIVQGEQNDVSGVFVNNDFSAGNANGWDITWKGGSKEATNIGYQGASYNNGDVSISGFIEAWKDGNSPNYLGDGSITQTIPSLPAGKYMLAVDVIANNQGRTSVEGNPNGHPDDVQLFAKASLDGKEFYTNLYTDNNKPEHFDFTFIHTGGSMTLGLRVVGSAEATMPANWIAMDNLMLYYYGSVDDDPDKAILDALVDEIKNKFPEEDFEDLHANKDDKQALTAALENAANAKEGEYVDAKDALQTAYDNLKASVEAYKKLQELIEFANLRASEIETDYMEAAEKVSDLASGWQDEYDDGTMTTETINTLADVLNNTIMDNVVGNLKGGEDISILLQNHNFDTDFSGWKTTGQGAIWGGNNPNPNGSDTSEEPLPSGCAERWHGKFSIYQTIRNLPAGAYSFRCQAFERCDDGSARSGYLFAELNGDASTRQMKLLPLQEEYATAEQVYAYGQNTPDGNDDVQTGDGLWVPNGMSGANFHFQHDEDGDGINDYTVTQNIILRETADLTIGIMTEGEHQWIIFDNVTLIYQGDNADVYKEVIDELIVDADQVFEEAGDNIGADAQKQYEDAKAASASAQTSAEYLDAIEALEATITYARESATAYTQLDEQYTGLADAMNESTNAQALENAQAVFDAIDKALTEHNLSVAEVNALIAKAKDAVGFLNAAEFPEDALAASDENPVDITADFIQNPTFDTVGDFTGWSEGFGAGGTTGPLAECYDKNFDVYQDIYGLEAGTYEVRVQGFYRIGSIPDDYDAWKATQAEDFEGTDETLSASLYARTSQATASTPIQHLFNGATANEISGSVSYASEEFGETLYVPNSMACTNTYFHPEGEGSYNPAYQVSVFVKVTDGKLRIGVYNNNPDRKSTSWAIFDDFQLIYYGANSAKEQTGDEGAVIIENVERTAAPVVYYNLAGQRVAQPARGIYIVNGKKVLVK